MYWNYQFSVPKLIGKDQGGTHSDNSVEGDDSSSSGLGSAMALDTMGKGILLFSVVRMFSVFFLSKYNNNYKMLPVYR